MLTEQQRLYASWKGNPYTSAEPVDPKQLKDALVSFMKSEALDSEGNPLGISLAQEFIVNGYRLAQDNPSQWQFLYRELQHDGIQKMQLTLDNAALTAVSDILAASGIHNVIDVTPQEPQGEPLPMAKLPIQPESTETVVSRSGLADMDELEALLGL